MNEKKRRPKRPQRRRKPRMLGLLEEAAQLHRSGKLTEAAKAYEAALKREPNNAQACYLTGVVYAELARFEEAITILQRAVTLDSEHLPALSQLAKLAQEAGQLEVSAGALRQLIALRPELGELHSNLSVVLERMERYEEAVATCQKAVELCPTSATVQANLGDLLRKTGRTEEAVAAYRRANTLDPGLLRVYRNLAALLRSRGDLTQAICVLREWEKHEPDNPIVQHMIAAYSGEETPVRASDEYVRKLFDEFAPTFDQDLEGLDYAAPRLIAAAIAAEVGEQLGGLEILDAGCGTGLCGPLLRPRARKLVGVDLSPVMLQFAQQRELYDELQECELITYLEEHPLSFDLIAAADTFNYFGSLEPLLKAARRALQGPGILIYTLEQSKDSGGTYRLNSHGRYEHTREYVERCMQELNYVVNAIERVTLRRERGESAPGLLVRARKAHGAREEVQARVRE